MHTNCLLRTEHQESMVCKLSKSWFNNFTSGRIGHFRQGSLATGAQMATRGRRDMSSRVRDVVQSLALCHNVSSFDKVA